MDVISALNRFRSCLTALVPFPTFTRDVNAELFTFYDGLIVRLRCNIAYICLSFALISIIVFLSLTTLFVFFCFSQVKINRKTVIIKNRRYSIYKYLHDTIFYLYFLFLFPRNKDKIDILGILV